MVILDLYQFFIILETKCNHKTCLGQLKDNFYVKGRWHFIKAQQQSQH